jgi:hypothetical protein
MHSLNLAIAIAIDATYHPQYQAVDRFISYSI